MDTMGPPLNLRRNHLILRTALALCAGAIPGDLQAACEACLRNGTREWLAIHRVPSPNRGNRHHPGILLGNLHGEPGAPRPLEPSFHPPGEAVLAVPPGGTAVLGWQEAPESEGTAAHLRIQIGSSGRRCIVV